MPLPLLPLVVVSLVGVAYHQSSKRETNSPGKGVLTPERQNAYQTAIKEVTDPAKLREVAKAFRDQGLPAHADMLEKRANLRAMPEEMKRERRKVFRRAMKSTNVTAIRHLANVYEQQGATGSALSLREYAATLPAVSADMPPAVVVAVQPVAPVAPPVMEAEPLHVSGDEPLDVPSVEAFTEEEETPSEE